MIKKQEFIKRFLQLIEKDLQANLSEEELLDDYFHKAFNLLKKRYKNVA